ncbi:MAG: thioesterase family protein [bacterium]|nr:thioesterase family protein [bacterium]
MENRFDRDTALTRLTDGRFEVRIDRGWWIIRGPNGGYIAAILAKAAAATIDDPGRPLRSLTIHFLRPPQEGPAEVEAVVERSGRTVTTVSVRLLQNGKVQAIATAAHAVPRKMEGFIHAAMPDVPPPSECAPRVRTPTPDGPTLHERYDQRFTIGPAPFSDEPRTREARSGGWIRLKESRPWDAAEIAAISDAWPPAVFASSDMPETTGGVPTVDLTVHLLNPEALAALAPEAFVLVDFTTRAVQGGYLEEDGEIWSEDGILLAQARQVGVVI